MNSMRVLKCFLISGLLLTASSSAFSADVGVSISIGQPGFYGRIDIGDYPYPQPRLIYGRPIIVHRHVDIYEPLYLRVPPGHAKNWSRHCSRYNACGHPVYFVQDSWYHNEYAPIYRERHDDGYRNKNEYNHGYGDRDEHNQGHGNKNGRGKGNGNGRR